MLSVLAGHFKSGQTVTYIPPTSMGCFNSLQMLVYLDLVNTFFVKSEYLEHDVPVGPERISRASLKKLPKVQTLYHEPARLSMKRHSQAFLRPDNASLTDLRCLWDSRSIAYYRRMILPPGSDSG